MAIKGQNLRLFIGTGANKKCIASSTSCQIHLAAQTEDSSTKDSTGNWSENEVTGKSWDISCDALVLTADPVSGGAKTVVDIIGLIGTEVDLSFDVTSGTNNRVAGSSTLSKSGKAIVSDVSITAANRQNSTYSVQFTGNGALS